MRPGWDTTSHSPDWQKLKSQAVLLSVGNDVALRTLTHCRGETTSRLWKIAFSRTVGDSHSLWANNSAIRYRETLAHLHGETCIRVPRVDPPSQQKQNKLDSHQQREDESVETKACGGVLCNHNRP